MANSIARLAILLTTDASGVGKGFAQAKGHVQGFSTSMGGASSSLAGIAAKAGLAGLAIGGVAAAFRGLSSITSITSELQSVGIAFEVMLGSAAKSRAMIESLREFAIESPFSTAGLAQNTQTLLQFGVEADKILPTLRMLGDISLGDAGKMDSLALAFGQMSAAGRLMGQDLLQMINAGFNPLQEMSRLTGISMAELKKEMEAGHITTEMVTAAFQSATQEGGRFFGMMQAQQNTLKGQWAKLMENLAVTFQPLGELIVTVLTKALTLINSLLEQINTLLGREQKQVQKLKEEAVNVAEAFAGLGAKGSSPVPDIIDTSKQKIIEFKRHGMELEQSIRNIQREQTTGAHSRFSAAGVSAAFQAGLELRRVEEVQKAQLVVQKEMARLEQLQLDEMKKEKPQVTIKAVGHL